MATDTDIRDVKAKTDIVALIERDLGPPARGSTENEAKWVCPFHADSDPSLTATRSNGAWYCFGCQAGGDAITWMQRYHNMTFQEAMAALNGTTPQLPAPIVVDPTELAQRKAERYKDALEAMSYQWPVAEQYHNQMPDRSYWYSQGLTDASIDRWKLGWCRECPTFRQSASHTIPITAGGRLLNIRHRLAQPQSKGDKYRPEMAGLPALMFGYDLCKTEPVLMLVEGEVKAMVLTQEGFPAVGIPGAATFKDHWVDWFRDTLEVFVTFDPGAEEQAAKVCATLGDKARLVTIGVKPDDFFAKYAGTRSGFAALIAQARMV